MPTDLEELEKVFIDEAFEMLQLFDSRVLELEKDYTNTKAINEAFRAVHTMKGGAASMGYTTLEKISHAIEDLLDLVRGNKLVITKDMVSILLKCSGLIEKLLSNISNQTPISEELENDINDSISAIKKYIGEDSQTQANHGKDENIIENKEVQTSIDVSRIVSDYISKGKKVFSLKFTFKEDSPLKELGILQVLSILKDAAEVIDSNPPIDEVYSKFFKNISVVISTDNIEKTLERVRIKDIVEEIQSTEIKGAIEQENKKDKSQPQKEETMKTAIIRIESNKIDSLMNSLGELVVTRSNINQNVSLISSLVNRVSEVYGDNVKDMKTIASEIIFAIKSGETREEVIVSLVDSLSENVEKLENLSSVVLDIKSKFEDLSNSIRLFNNISIELQEKITDLRLIPIDYLFSRLPRFVRETADMMGKEVNLIIKGQDTKLDKSVIDEVFDPIVHLIRNSIDHGIESKEERMKLGKSPKGNIIVEAFNEGNSVIIRVKDDGRGIDFEKIKKKGIEKGLIKDGIDYSKEQLLSLIFLPGFSTKDEVSNISGRGVGMDIVKAKVEKLRGSISISTSEGKGTVFLIKLPLTVAIMKVLMFDIKGIIFAVPVNSIEEAITIRKSDVTKFENRSIIKIRDEVIRIYSFREIYFDEVLDKEELDVLVCSYLGKKYAFSVDKFLGEEDIFIRPIDTTLVPPPGIVSATILGNGKIGYVIDIGNLISYLEKKGIA
jgi:two-component system chemotaxis sensor kinase CheA